MSDEPKPSPYHFDIYACPECENMITTSVYPLITIDAPYPECGKVKVSEYQLRKAKPKWISLS